MELRFARRAVSDMEEIGDFIATDNPVRSRSFIRELRERCERITDFPEAAPLRPLLGAGVRVLIYGRYLILYAIHDTHVEVRRIVHGARDLDTLDLD